MKLAKNRIDDRTLSNMRSRFNGSVRTVVELFEIFYFDALLPLFVEFRLAQ